MSGHKPSTKRVRKPKAAKSLAPVVEELPQVEFGANYTTAQIYNKGFEFAFMSKIQKVYRQICTFAFCKDFFHDLVWAFVNQKPWSIYNFQYNPAKDHPLDMDNCVFAFRNTQFKKNPLDFHKQRATCQDFLNQLEKKIGLQPTRIFEVPHEGGPCWLVIGDKGWQVAPPMLGFFTLFIRVGFAHTRGESYETTLEKCRKGILQVGDGRGAGCHDPSYIQQAWKGLQALLTHGLDTFHPDIKDNYPLDLKDKLSLHNAVGPVNWTAGQAKKAMPRWYKHL